MASQYNTRLKELKGSGFEIADEQPGIQGWTIKDFNGRNIGKVDDLLFDPQLRKVRYIVADLRSNDFGLEKRKVLIPVGIAELHEQNDHVIIPSVRAWQLRALPKYTRDGLTEDDEQDIFSIFSVAGADAVTGPALHQQPVAAFYDHANFNEGRMYRNRNQGTGPRVSQEPQRYVNDSSAVPARSDDNPDNAGRPILPEHDRSSPDDRHTSGDTDTSHSIRIAGRRKS